VVAPARPGDGGAGQARQQRLDRRGGGAGEVGIGRQQDRLGVGVVLGLGSVAVAAAWLRLPRAPR